MAVTWLHISDFHVRAGDSYDRDVVLRALVKSVAEYRARGLAPDVIFATGDIAHSGKEREYEIAGKFFDNLLSAAELKKNRLFVIPGNHDVDRELGVGLARTLDSREQSDSYFHPELPKPHLTQKMRAFLDWHNKYFDGIRAMPSHSTCGPVELLAVNGRRLGILPINSALFCQGDDDHDKLWIGRRCLDESLSALRKIDTEINIVLVHHPLEWLSSIEGANIQAEIEGSVQILLRGHLHETRVDSIASAEGEMLRCAAGAAYQTRKWPNRAQYGTLDGARLTIYPIRYEDAPTEIWTTDPSVFPHEDNHRRAFEIPGQSSVSAASQAAPSRAAALPRFRSNITARGNLPFVGRDDLLAEIGKALSDPNTENVVALHGPPGVGKSALAREFARQNRDRYSGGTFLVDCTTDAIAINLAGIGKNILDLSFPSDLPINDQGQQTFHALGAAPVLLIYDNVVSFDRISPWLPLSAMPCHALLTTLLDTSDLRWPRIEVRPLSRQQSLELVEKLTGGQLAASYCEAIADHAGGLPVQIVPDAATLAYEKKRGRLKPASRLHLAPKAGDSFRAAYGRLEQPARLLLHTAAFLNTQRILTSELSQHLCQGLGWSEVDFERTLDTCLDLHLLDGTPDPSMHQLFATFLRETLQSAEDQAALRQVRKVQAGRFVELANSLATNPADAQTATALMSYPLEPATWAALGEPLSVQHGKTAGRALCEMGRFDEARPWFERAVTEVEKGDVHGIEHDNLAYSLHEVGYCLASTGRDDEARSWFERAVAEHEKGDLLGRIDRTELGRSLYQVGYCLLKLGLSDEARPWFERSVAEAEKGDLHGRTDHESLGRGLHEVGYCLWSVGRYDEARPWFERAVAEKKRGDVRGRIDHDSVGSSLDRVGSCLSIPGHYDNARPWFERAIAEKEQGDVHGRIDHDGLGISLHWVGHCLASMGRYEEARPWLERAVAEKEQGDVHGRINHETLRFSVKATADCLRKLGLDDLAGVWKRRATTG